MHTSLAISLLGAGKQQLLYREDRETRGGRFWAANAGRLGMDKDARNRKHGRSTILGKEMFLD